MTDPTQPFPPVRAFVGTDSTAAVVRAAIRRARRVRALKLLGAILYLGVCAVVAVANPAVLFIPALLLLGAFLAGVGCAIRDIVRNRRK